MNFRQPVIFNFSSFPVVTAKDFDLANNNANKGNQSLTG